MKIQGLDIEKIRDFEANLNTEIMHELESIRTLDSDVRRLIDDLLNNNNVIRWTDGDIENFLKTKGKMVFKCVVKTMLDNNDNLIATLVSEGFKQIEKIIVCVYSNTDLTIIDYEKILQCVENAVSENSDILCGWIQNEKTDKISAMVKLLAICSE
jgi:cell division GTPase FtsZ